jgi:hypothetical protein
MPEFKDKATFNDVEVVQETEAALLCRIDGRDVWIPKSQIDDDSEVYEKGTEGELVVSQWIAEQKKLV